MRRLSRNGRDPQGPQSLYLAVSAYVKSCSIVTLLRIDVLVALCESNMETEEQVLVFYVNGRRQEVKNLDVDLTLVSYLRDVMLLRGTKVGCGGGDCGSCTVTISRFVDDSEVPEHTAASACLTRVASLHETAVTTVEGLGNPRDGLHPVQERIYKAHGSQCGFCTPGMVMAMSSRLRQDEVVDIEDVERCLQGNLCRCTGYRPILEAFETFCSKRKDNGTPAKAKNEEILKVDIDDFKPYSGNDDPEMPPELKVSSKKLLKLKNSSSSKLWYRPTTLQQLSDLQKELAAFHIYGGGTAFYMDPADFAPVIQIGAVKELQGVTSSNGFLKVGSAMTLTRLERELVHHPSSSIARALLKALRTLGSPQVRGAATVGGSLMWGNIAVSDLIPIYMATGCRVKFQTDQAEQIVTYDNNFDSRSLPKKAIVVALLIPVPQPGFCTYFFRQAKRKEFCLPIANGCIHVRITNDVISEIKVAFGGAESTLPGSGWYPPRLATALQTVLEGKTMEEAREMELDDIIPHGIGFSQSAPGDLTEYRRNMLLQFVYRFLYGHIEEEPEVTARKSTVTCQKIDPNLDPVTRPIPNMWAAEQASGTAIYVDDIKPLPDEVQIVLIQSAEAHAKIKRINYSDVLKAEGVIGIVTKDDLDGERNLFGAVVDDETVFAGEEVLYYGQVIAGIVCTSLKAGRNARKLLRLEYEALPAILSINQAIEKGKRVTDVLRLKKYQGPIRRDKIHNIRGSIHVGGQEHFYLEPHASLVIPTGEKDELTVFTNNQHPRAVQEKVARLLELPMHKVSVKTKRLGGAFGGKSRLHNVLIAAIAAWKFRRPARLTFTRRDDIVLTGHRHELKVDYDVDFDEVGWVLRADFNCFLNAGISQDLSHPWGCFLLNRLDGGYTLRNFSGEATGVFTNTPSNTAMRGFGGPEGQFVIDSIMEQIAHTLKMDPTYVREINLTRDNDVTHTGDTVFKDVTLEQCWHECKRKSDYEGKREQVERFNDANYPVKRGLCMVPLKFGCTTANKTLMQGGALVQIFTDGSVHVAHGGVEMGQGLHTKMIQVASKALGVPHEIIHLTETSTHSVPNTTETGGSTGTDLNGLAVIDACETLNKRLKSYRKPEKSWKEAITDAYTDRVNLSSVGFFDWSRVDYDFESNKGNFSDYWTYGAGCVQVEVNCLSGDVTVVSADLVLDLGKALNPAIDIGQIEGAFMQGLGYATTEQLLHHSKSGRLLTTCPATYHVPTVCDVPRELNITLLRNEKPVHGAVFSAKGIGEPALGLGSTGVALAVRDAVASYRKERGNTDWFHIGLPNTVDKIAAAAREDFFQELFEDETKLAMEM